MPSARVPTIGDRIVISLICSPVTVLLGWALFKLLAGGFSANLDWFTRLVLVVGTEIVAAMLAIFACASLWSITGRDLFDRLVFRSLRKVTLDTIGFVAIAAVTAMLL